MSYYTYILECADKTLYTGFTNNLEKRLIAHNFSKKGAHYTKTRRPVILRYHESFVTKSEALKREFALKKLERVDKFRLINSFMKNNLFKPQVFANGGGKLHSSSELLKKYKV